MVVARQPNVPVLRTAVLPPRSVRRLAFLKLAHRVKVTSHAPGLCVIVPR